MSRRGAAAALAGGLGLVALVITAAVVAAVALVALGLPAEGRAGDAPPSTAEAPPTAPSPPARPGELVVALAPGDPVMQAGVVRGRDVLLARGFEVALARAIAERLRIPRVRFVDVSTSRRFLLGGAPRWDIAVAGIRPTRLASERGTVTRAYLTTDTLVLLRRGTARPRSLAELRTRIVCAMRGREAARTASWLRPVQPPIVAPGPARLVRLVQTGACDAALLDTTEAGRVLDGSRAVLGPLAARVRWDAGVVAVVHRGAPVTAARVDRAIAALRADGTIGRLAKLWLGLDPATLPMLR